MTTVLPQPIEAADVREEVARVAWMKPAGGAAWMPDGLLLRGLYQLAGHEAPREEPPAAAISVPVRPRRPVLAPRQRPKPRVSPALAKLRISQRQISKARRQRIWRTPSENRIDKYDRFQLFSEWTGHIVDVDDARFSSRMTRPRHRGSSERVLMHFPLALVRAEDRELLEPGAPLLYCVGRFFDSGRPVPGSVLWFRRLGRSPRSPTDALEAGAKWSRRIGWTNL